MDDPSLFETMYTSRALRRFKPDPVPDDLLFQVLDAAIRAPTGQNAQDWRFVIVTDPEVKQQMQAWASEGWEAYASRFPDIDSLPRTQRLSLHSVRDLAHNLESVPVLIVVCGLRGRHSTPGGSTLPAVQNMLLAARGLGLAATIFNLGNRPQLAELLGIPEQDEVVCTVPVGYPVDRHGPVRRKPVAKVVYRERWGEPWAFAEAQPSEGWTSRWISGRS